MVRNSSCILLGIAICSDFRTCFGITGLLQDFVVETDACGGGIGAVLMQQGQPLAYFGKALAPKHVSLSIYEKELLDVVQVVEQWHQYLERGKFIVRTDQQSLKYLLGQKLKTPLQMYWIAKLLGYDSEIQYKKGNDNTMADVLSRLHDSQILQISLDTSSPELMKEIRQSWDLDSDIASVFTQAKEKGGVFHTYTWDGSYLRKNNRLVVGNVAAFKNKLLEWLHSSPQGGHSGIQGTYYKVKGLF
ncbi:hypothetical protein QN277_019051 [Acacia crassicarpa]|uniref:Reverse transcriptase RNase H-like domain-containing protein n=1 Tax=Acacia crassicarpa TaxID=499986 RepID=A0AAE1JVU0_9FABA|nr:hypothetical protein QN277_019051 [Acacia crassicarpa]